MNLYDRVVRVRQARVEAVQKVFLLGETYVPGANLLARPVGKRMRPGQSLTLQFR